MEHASFKSDGGPKSTKEHPASRITNSSFLNVTARFVVVVFLPRTNPTGNPAISPSKISCSLMHTNSGTPGCPAVQAFFDVVWCKV